MTKQELENRTILYGLISRLMIAEVDCAFLKNIDNNKSILELFPNYKRWPRRKELSCGELISTQYDVDFANLFLMHLVPYESFYTREDQMIESGGENPVVSLYNALDFRVELDKARVVSPDHIGVELEFMYMLCVAIEKAYNAKDNDGMKELIDIQKGFLKDHLLVWAPMFLMAMKNESRTPLYHDGADLALEFILSDFEYLSNITKPDKK
ncbi:MAG: molecular chaperone TorD family protein [Sulfurovaceae bacterium]|nr:molecular chaperone TorD family protein [Sulfurovaceae bacterium]MDD5549138.1 molecular chaperone TorD family protein [Sulfurovaceae bacterium]